jgi:pentose-5-phosphate-3-epimerase
MHIDEMTDDDIAEIIVTIKPHKIYLGLCVSNDKNVPSFVARVRAIEMVYSKVFIQVMGIDRIGAQGQPFDDRVLKRISYIHDECRNISIQVDGAMNPETALLVKNRGARCAVIGSYLFSQGGVKKNLDRITKNFI